MRTCVFTELLVLSYEERGARRVRFDPNATLIIGGNDTGKSSLIKSLYATFGADPAVTHPAWTDVRALTLVRFRYDERHFTMLRHGQTFALFDGDGVLIRQCNRVGSELAPFLAEFFDFQLVLTNRAGDPVVPPPAFMLLPFYVDQDASWQRNWSGFSGLGQFGNWRRSVIEYHVGIRPNRYYQLKSEGDVVKRTIEEQRGAERALRSARNRVEQHLPRSTFTIDLGAFQREIDALLMECEELSRAEEQYKSALVGLRSTKVLLLEQVAITQRALKELRADYRFATHHVGESVECPTCGAAYDNNFADRFRLAVDEDRCRDLLVQLNDDVVSVNDRIAAAEASLGTVRNNLGRLHELLGATREGVRLKDLLASEGRKELKEVFFEGLRDYALEIRELEGRQKAVQRQLQELTDSDRRERILAYYRHHTRQYLENVNVSTMRPSHYADVTGRIAETGSDQPRALLAYYYSVLHTMREFGSTTFFPLVIDSPNQQAQDAISLPKVLDFIVLQRPPGTQLVLGLEERPSVEHGGVEVMLDRKHRVLSKDEYEAAREEVRPLLDALFAAQAGEDSSG